MRIIRRSIFGRLAGSAMASGWAASTASDSRIVAIGRKSFKSSVEPVAVSSTIASARPRDGATSTDPLMVMISGRPPSSLKYRRADSGWDVAERRHDQLAVAEPERRELFNQDVLLVQEVAADNAEIDRAEPYVARNI